MAPTTTFRFNSFLLGALFFLFASNMFFSTNNRMKYYLGDWPLGKSERTRDNTSSPSSATTASYASAASLMRKYKYDGKVEALWNCSGDDTANSHRSRKLIFIHVFKTAGSTFRTFFNEYALRCHVGYTVLIHCSGLDASTTVNSTRTWSNRFGNGKGTPCMVKKALTSHGEVKGKKMTSSFLGQDIDMLIGHLPIGIHKYWKDADGLAVDVDAQYVAFFRDPVHKFVSGSLFVNKNKNLSFAQAVSWIKLRVQTGVARNEHYDGYGHYLLTPEQKAFMPTREQRTRMVLSNLLEFQVVVGIVERMTESLEVLQLVVDGSKELSDAFGRLDTQNIQSNSSETALIRNKSELSTDAIVDELRRDKSFYSQLQVYLKYDFPIYSFALQVHERQYQWILRNLGRSG